MLPVGVMRRGVMGFVLLLLASVSAYAGPPAGTADGGASYYADSLHGNKTASSEPYDRNAMTAARALGLIDDGTGQVRIEVITP